MFTGWAITHTVQTFVIRCPRATGMTGSVDAFPEGAIEDVAYLSRTDSRVRLLDAIATQPYTRSELEEATGIARTTIGRVINEFEKRGWARRTADGEYTTTPTGTAINTEFTPFVESIQAIRNLGDLVAWLPTDEVPIDLRHFNDATIHRPEPADPMSTVTDFNARLDGVGEFQCLVGIAPPVPFEREMVKGVENRGLETKHVITDNELDYLLDNPDRCRRWQQYLKSGANVYCYAGQIPCNVFVFDETVIITNSQSDYGEPHAGIESEEEAVLSWAQEVIEKYRNEANRLDPMAFSGE